MGNRTRQKNKRGDSKVESNDSPDIPDRGETSDIPGLPGGGGVGTQRDWHKIDLVQNGAGAQRNWNTMGLVGLPYGTGT